MSVSFGGIALIHPPDDLLRVAVALPLRTFETPTWTGLGGRGADYAFAPDVPIGTLFWPTGASRFAVGRFLCAGSQLDSIRALVKPTLASATAPIPLTLTLGDGTRSISTSMYLLSPQPILQFGSETIWLLTFVDVRYFWWTKSAAISINAGTTTWANVVAAIGTALGETLTLSSVDAEYLKPHPDLDSNYDYLPPLLDAVAYSVGRRVVRKLDGTITLQTPAEATTRRDALIGSVATYNSAGGSFAFGVDGGTGYDLWAVSPDTVGFSVRNLDITVAESPCSCDEGTVTETTRALTGLALSEYASVGQYAGTKLVRSTAVRWMDGVTQQNDAELQTLVDQWATDWYRWRLADQLRLLGGVIFQWDGDGFADAVEWNVYGQVMTRLARGPLNDLANRVWHLTESGETGRVACCGDWTWTAIKTGSYNPAIGEAVRFDVTGGNRFTALPTVSRKNDKIAICPLYTAGANRVILSGNLVGGGAYNLNGVVATGNNLGTGYASGEGMYVFIQASDDGDDWWCERPLT